MDRHVQRGQRHAKFVRGGGIEVVPELVKPTQAGDVLEQHGDAGNPLFTVKRARAHEKVPVTGRE
jgi:hypothetical protein